MAWIGIANYGQMPCAEFSFEGLVKWLLQVITTSFLRFEGYTAKDQATMCHKYETQKKLNRTKITPINAVRKNYMGKLDKL